MRNHHVFRPLSGLAVICLLGIVAVSVPATTYADYHDCIDNIRQLQTKAQAGDAEAQNALAWCYIYGDGVAEDKRHGLELMTKAAEQGNADAMTNLGCIYEGMVRGIPKNRQKAVKWHREAARQGVKQSQEALRSWGLSW